MIIDLLLINAIVVLVHLSGFWTNLDEWVSKRVPPYHLPHLFVCALCQCWWLSLLYVIITGNLSLLTIALCLFSALLTEVTAPLITIVINWLKKVLMWIMPKDI